MDFNSKPAPDVTPDDIKNMTARELDVLCEGLRRDLVHSVAKTGGHLSPNLGVVELTVALHRVFDLQQDRLVFDVGHQCYVHKMLTGRRAAFSTLRKLGGLSGFPKPEESGYDAFIAGHASNSVSVALGLARARTRLNQPHSVIALIGDGALTGGLSYEALADAGDSGEPLIVVLNDNGMSITENVGGMARYLSRERLRPSYNAFKKWYRRATKRLPRFYAFTHKLKLAVKHALLHCSMFEEMGFEYLGPLDGHDILTVTRALEWARDMKKPVIIHTITQKGRGYAPSEASPEVFHGVTSFDPDTGEVGDGGETFSSAFGAKMLELARRDNRVVAITAAMAQGTGLEAFGKVYPDRFFDVGIAEGHATALSAGLAAGGLIPVFAVYSTFLQRGYDMLLHDVALSGAHAVFAVDRAGIVPGDGETHQGVYDVAYLATVPDMTVYAPASLAELRDMLEIAVLRTNGAVAVRYPKGGEGAYRDGGSEASKTLRTGTDVTIVTYGTMVNTTLSAAELLTKNGVNAEVIKLGRIVPPDVTHIRASVLKTRKLLVLEDVVAAGCVGERVLSRLMQDGIAPEQTVLMNVGERTLPCGTVEELRALCGLTAENVAAVIREQMSGDGAA